VPEPLGAEERTVLVTGGAGYVGSALVPRLLDEGYRVKVLDTFWFGRDVLKPWRSNQNLIEIESDLRDANSVSNALDGCSDVIHLACISNDPSYELDPDLGRSINYEAFGPLIDLAVKQGVNRFVYASSSSVYGVKAEDEVSEELSLEPLTDYSRFKAMCEPELLRLKSENFAPVVLRPATVCGYSPRLRLDLTVNILTNHAINRGEITVFGGSQTRPNIHIDDMVDAYLLTLASPAEKISGQIYNVGFNNMSVNQIAEAVRGVISPDIRIKVETTDDLRSYRVTSQKIKTELGFTAKFSVEEAIRDLKDAFKKELIPDSFLDPRYFNLATMKILLNTV
jgi:nucleoside-diphosphate-sugar epimerase